MARKSAGSRNRGKSLLNRGSGNIKFNSSQIFIGVVDHVVNKDSENLQTEATEGSNISEYVDNRNTVYVIPIDRNKPNTLIKAHFVNSHNIDMPLPSEAVLCCKTSVGYIIIDRFSPNAFGTNFELSDYLLSQKLVTNGDFNGMSVEASDDLKEQLGIKPIQKVAPFFQKQGANAFFGRNNQYLILDYGERLESDNQEMEYSKDGSFIKLGIKQSGEQIDTKNDPSFVVVGENAKIQQLLEAQIESEFNKNENEEPNNGVGVQSDQLVFFGREFVVIYTQKDMLLNGEGNLYLEFQEIINKANKIKLGKDADEPIVLGNEFVNMMDELIDIILSIRHQTTQGPTLNISPESRANLQRFRSRYLRKNNSPVHSKKTFSD